jgi:hypothetical protein
MEPTSRIETWLLRAVLAFQAGTLIYLLTLISSLQ